jgi:phosphatidylinositol alpha-1,6-mannosyltransferase
VAEAVSQLLLDPERARLQGAAGRAWVESSWQWDQLGGRLRNQLAGQEP